MTKIAFIGDAHIQFSNPSSRIDNYFIAIINKLQQIMRDNQVIVSLGDLFSNPVLDIQGLIILLDILTKYKAHGGRFYTIAGNHDACYNWSLNSINKTSIGLLVKLGLVILINPFEVEGCPDIVRSVKIDDYIIQCTNLNQPKQLPLAKSDNTILVGHNYYNFARDTKHSLEYEDLAGKGYKYCFLGHDHSFYPPKTIENEGLDFPTILYRPGSLGREAAHSYNFTREIIYYQLDTDTDKVTPVKIDHAPASEVFSVEVLDRHENPTPTYVYDLEELMKNFKTKNTISISIKKMLEDNPEIPDEIVQFIADCHSACNVPFV